MDAKSQTAATAALAHQREFLTEAVAFCEANPGPKTSRLQNLICLAIPAYNIFASFSGWPLFPVPAFCNTPTPAAAKGGEK